LIELLGSDRQDVNFALKWTVTKVRNEQQTFILMNKAKNFEDYNIAWTLMPAQHKTLILLDQSGDIAMPNSRKIPFEMEGAGKIFLWIGADPRMEWQKDSFKMQTKMPLTPQPPKEVFVSIC